jgi:predicted nucleic acid-binding protein
MSLARRAAAVRVRTRLKLPDTYALATAIHAEKRGHGEVRLESFDEKVVKAFAALHSVPNDLG